MQHDGSAFHKYPENVAVADQTRLYIIGLGVSIPSHITSQATTAMASCDGIFTVVQEPPNRWLPPECRMHVPVKNLLEIYVEGALRTDNYEKVATLVFGSLSRFKTVGYVTYGNPMSYDSVSRLLVDLATRDEIRFEIVPGVSSVDTLLCDLALDMAPGIQIYEASWLVAAQVKLDPTNAVLLLQLGTFGSFRTHYRDSRGAETLGELSGFLAKLYPSNHQIILVQSSNGSGSSRIRRILLKDLDSRDLSGILNCSMYIPPIRAAAIASEIILKMQTS